MNMMAFKKCVLSLFIFTAFCACSVPLVASPLIVEELLSPAPSSFIPRGTEDALVLSFKVSTTGSSPERLQSISFENPAGDLHIGSIDSDITSAALFFETGAEFGLQTSGVNADRLLARGAGSDSFSFALSGISPPIDLPTVNANAVTFYLTYSIKSSAQLFNIDGVRAGELRQASAVLTHITVQGAPQSFTGISHTFSIAGFQTLSVQNAAPTFIIPGQRFIPMLYVEAKTAGIDLFGTFISMKFSDSNSNLVTSNTQSNGISKIHLRQATSAFNDGLGIANENFPADNGSGALGSLPIEPFSTLPTDLGVGVFPPSSNFEFTYPPLSFKPIADLHEDFNGFGTTTTFNFYLLYDLGDETVVTADRTVNAALSLVSGKTAIASNSPYPITEVPIPNATASTKVAGLSVARVDEVPFSGTFQPGPGTTFPMLSFILRSHGITSNVLSATVANSGAFNFSSTKIVRVDIYQDIDHSNGLSYETDRLVASQDFSNPGGANNVGISETLLPFTVPVQVGPYNASAGIYPNATREEKFFVVYKVAQTIDSAGSLRANAQLTQVSSSLNVVTRGNVPISKLYNVPDVAALNPTSFSKTINSSSPRISLVEVKRLNPGLAPAGAQGVPFLAVKLFSSHEMSTASKVSFSLFSFDLSFTSLGTGFSRLYLYRDRESVGITDQFDPGDGGPVASLAASEFLNTQTVSFSDVPISSGLNTFYVVGDLGTADAPLTLQFNGLAPGVGGATFTFFGEVPAPLNLPAYIQISSRNLMIGPVTPVNPSTALTNLSKTTAFQYTITNNLGTTIENFRPLLKVYKSNSDLGGPDITHEFTINRVGSVLTSTIAPDDALTVQFNISHGVNIDGVTANSSDLEEKISQGAAKLDAYVEFNLVGNSTPIFAKRYDAGGGAGFRGASSAPFDLNLSGTGLTPYAYPSFIKGIFYKLSSGSPLIPFSNGGALSRGNIIVVQLQNGSDTFSFTQLKVDGNLLSESVNPPSRQGIYTLSNGNLEFKLDSERTSSQLEIIGTDTAGNNQSYILSYVISDTLNIYNALFYPNPYVYQSQYKFLNFTKSLILGFQITQPATVEYYIFNHLGMMSKTGSAFFSAIGYNEFQFLKGDADLPPGAYLCRIIARGNDGNTVQTQTKLVIY